MADNFFVLLFELLTNDWLTHANLSLSGASLAPCAPSPTVRRHKVMHLMQCTNLGGMEQAAYWLMRKLQATKRFSFRVASPRPFGDGARAVRDVDASAIAFNCSGRFGWRNRGGLRDWVREQSADSDLVWVTGTCAASLAAIQNSRAPKVLSHHHFHLDGRGSWLRWRAFYELFGRQLDAVVYPTEFTRAEAVSIVPWLEPRSVVIRNGVEPRPLDEAGIAARRRLARRRLGLPERRLLVGGAGWFVPGKRFDVFLRVAARVHARRPDSLFLLCGGGPDEDQLRKRVSELRLNEAVRFEGWVHSMDSYYEALDVVLFNSDREAFGRVPLEAANRGALVVASVRYGGLHEFVEHGVNGVLLDEHDDRALAEAVVNLADGPRGPGMRAAAYRKIHQEFSIEAAASKSERLFEHLCSGSRD